jgi:hypothetical protein
MSRASPPSLKYQSASSQARLKACHVVPTWETHRENIVDISDRVARDREGAVHSYRQPSPLYSFLYGIISKIRCVLPRNFSLEKYLVPGELALIAISLACLVAQCNSYGGSWKWVTILPILVRFSSCCLPFVSLFLHMCTNNCIHLIVKSLDTQLSSVFYLYWDLSWCRISFWKGDLKFSYIKCTE